MPGFTYPPLTPDRPPFKGGLYVNLQKSQAFSRQEASIIVHIRVPSKVGQRKVEDSMRTELRGSINKPNLRRSRTGVSDPGHAMPKASADNSNRMELLDAIAGPE